MSEIQEPSAPLATIVGEAPGFTGEGRPPLQGRNGERLAEVFGLESSDELRRRFDLVNLLDYFPGRAGRSARKGAAFPIPEARAIATIRLPTYRGKFLILLGKRVAQAFGVQSPTYFEWYHLDAKRWAVVIPHPSGVNRWWNEEKNRKRAEIFCSALLEEE